MPGAYVRALIGIAASAVLALIGAFQSYGLLADFSRQNQDPYRIEAQQERFAGVAAMLPADAVVGYISDLPYANSEGSANFFGVQYALAPRLLVEESERHKQRWVVGNFWKKPNLAEIEETYHLRLVRDFGAGARLFRRAE
jgi:hypothetical protein